MYIPDSMLKKYKYAIFSLSKKSKEEGKKERGKRKKIKEILRQKER